MLTELGSIARVAELQRPRPRMYSRPHVGCSRSYMLHVSRCYMQKVHATGHVKRSGDKTSTCANLRRQTEHKKENFLTA